jgi:hypothetical protein
VAAAAPHDEDRAGAQLERPLEVQRLPAGEVQGGDVVHVRERRTTSHIAHGCDEPVAGFVVPGGDVPVFQLDALGCVEPHPRRR